MLVSQVMSHSLISVSPEDSAACAARLLAHHNVGALPVCNEDGRLRGLLTDRDITIRLVADEMGPMAKVKDVCSKNVVAVEAHADVREAGELMATHKIRRLPVVCGGKVIGMLSLADIARTNQFHMEAGRILHELSL